MEISAIPHNVASASSIGSIVSNLSSPASNMTIQERPGHGSQKKRKSTSPADPGPRKRPFGAPRMTESAKGTKSSKKQKPTKGAITASLLKKISSSEQVKIGQSAVNAKFLDALRKILQKGQLQEDRIDSFEPLNQISEQDQVTQDLAARLSTGQPLTSYNKAWILRKPRGKYTDFPSYELDGPLSATAAATLKESCGTTPYYLARAVTLSDSAPTRPRQTNGFTTDCSFYPSAALDGRKCAASISDVQHIAPMVADHLAWKDRIQDELLSWTDSWLFAIVHLYLRHLKGQEDGYLCCIDRRAAVEHGTQEPADFFHALDLSNAIHLPKFDWGSYAQKALQYGKFTHEYLTHGIIELPSGGALQPVSWETLFLNGVFSLIPELRVPNDMEVKGLFTVLLHLRKTNYPRWVKYTTEEELAVAESLTRQHIRRSETDTPGAAIRPPLAIFVHYLSLRTRSSKDELFQAKIRELGYTRADLDDLLHDGYEILPDNLPEKLSVYRLLKAVQKVVGGEPLKKVKFLRHDKVYKQRSFLSAEMVERKKAKLFFDPSQEQKEGKNSKHQWRESSRFCRLSCHCAIWKNKHIEGTEELTEKSGGESGKSGIENDQKKRGSDEDGGIDEDDEAPWM